MGQQDQSGQSMDRAVSAVFFEAKPSRWLRRQGVRGSPRVRLNPDGIGIIGGEGGALEVGPTRVRAFRVGTERLFRGAGFHEACFSIAGRSGHLVLRPQTGHAEGFGEVAVGFARLIEAGGHPARLELGESRGRVLFIALVMALPLSLVALLVGLGPWHLAPAVVWAGLILSAGLAIVGLAVAWRGRPKLARDLAEFEAAVGAWVARSE